MGNAEPRDRGATVDSRRRGARPREYPGHEGADRASPRLDDWLDVPFAILSLIWVVLLIVELANLAPAHWSVDVYRLDSLIWGLFLAHFLLELAIAPSKTRYLRTHFLTAISVVLPFLRVIRLIRVVSLLRTLSLARILLSANRATRSASSMLQRHRFGYVAVVVSILALLGAAGVSYFEQAAQDSPLANFGDALWWSATMVTTINVGAEPVTTEGRVIAFLLRIVGLALFSYIAGSVASYFVGEQGRLPATERPRTLGSCGDSPRSWYRFGAPSPSRSRARRRHGTEIARGPSSGPPGPWLGLTSSTLELSERPAPRPPSSIGQVVAGSRPSG